MSNFQSQSSGNQTSTSSSTPVQTPQNAFLDQLASYQQQLEQQQYAWGQQQFANNTTLTDNNISQYLANAAPAFGLAGQQIGAYANEFLPEYNNLTQEANSYASQPRVQAEMGRAEAGAEQAGESGRTAALADLQSYGIDPSAGRYAALDNAERLQNAASAAGAGNQARLATEATGRGLQSEAIQTGELIPGQVANMEATGYSGLSGAENAGLANTTVGSQILGTPTQYGQIGMQDKLPPIGYNSSSQGSQQSTSRGGGTVNFGAGQQNNGLNTPSGPTQYNPDFQPYNPAYFGSGNSSDTVGDQTDTAAQGSDYSAAFGTGAYSGVNPGSAFYSTNGLPNYDSSPASDTGGGIAPDYNFSDTGDNSGFSSNDFVDPNSGDQSSYDINSDFSGGDSGGDSGGSADTSDTTDGFQTGGPIPGGMRNSGVIGYDDGGATYDPTDPTDPTTGGSVPFNASPSGGVNTDDVNAHVNAGEFIMPRDVATWKGHEFFANLINKSRQARQAYMQQVRPQHKPVQRGARPNFVSRSSGGAAHFGA